MGFFYFIVRIDPRKSVDSRAPLGANLGATKEGSKGVAPIRLINTKIKNAKPSKKTQRLFRATNLERSANRRINRQNFCIFILKC